MASQFLLGTRVDATNYESATTQILGWARAGDSRTVCAANVHVVMEAHDSDVFRAMVNSTDLVTSDGMPLVWLLRIKGIQNQPRVYGPTLMMRVLEAAATAQVPVGFYGGMPEVLSSLQNRTIARFPALKIAYACSPPFHSLSEEEDGLIVEQINASGAKILFVGLGCPKQEIWMAAHRGRVRAVMLGVGAAFDFHAGEKPQAPAWMQNSGLEWFFRLLKEPRRLWRRYLYHNPRFLWFVFLEWAGLYRPSQGG